MISSNLVAFVEAPGMERQGADLCWIARSPDSACQVKDRYEAGA